MGLNTTPRTGVAGEVVTAAEMNSEVRDAFAGIQAAWTAYTPVLTASTTNPTGQTFSGSAWIRFGSTVIFRAVVSMAATAGTGNYSLTLPVAPRNAGIVLITGSMYDTSASLAVPAFLDVRSGITTSAIRVLPTTAGTYLASATAASPFAVAAGDIFTFDGVYEAA
jgi:hypothetical protein